MTKLFFTIFKIAIYKLECNYVNIRIYNEIIIIIMKSHFYFLQFFFLFRILDIIILHVFMNFLTVHINNNNYNDDNNNNNKS